MNNEAVLGSLLGTAIGDAPSAFFFTGNGYLTFKTVATQLI